MAKRDGCPLFIIAAGAAVLYTLTGFKPVSPTDIAQTQETIAEPPAVTQEVRTPKQEESAEAAPRQEKPAEAASGQEKPAETAPKQKPKAQEPPAASARQLTRPPEQTVAAPKPSISQNARTVAAQTPDWKTYRRFDAPVDAYYFTDALFIGDSRTVGLSEYCPDLDAQATFYSKVSLTVKAALDKAFVKTETGKKSVDELLSGDRQYKKIYVMLGINELGGGTAESFREDYRVMLERIREKQPGAIIFIQSIMHVTAKKSNGDRHINNERVNERNAAIAELADEEHGIYYLNLNEALDDENGDLNAALSFDGVHLKAASYGLWYDYLRTHAMVSRNNEDDDA